jgi:hypothetical protein
VTHKPWYHKGLRFECQGSGNCCRNHGSYAYVYLMPAEVTAIAGHLGLGEDEFLARWCVEDGGWTCLRMDRPACPFLDDGNRCGIYPVRPKQCATWPFWTENLDQRTWETVVQACCPGAGVGPRHSQAEIERIARENDEHYEDPQDAPRSTRPDGR